MLPSRQQCRNWSLPSKCSFWAAAIGIPASLLGLALPLVLAVQPTPTQEEARPRLLLNAAQELRYNHEWLTAIAAAHKNRASTLPTGRLKTQALMTLIERDYKSVTEQAYGEEKYIYQLALRLQDLGAAVGPLKSSAEIAAFNRRADFTLHDIHFLNNFLFWYIAPMIVEEPDRSLPYSLGWGGLPGKELKIASVKKIKMKYFLHDGKPITEYGEYLGLID